jgi:hypothetical protein
LGALVIEAMPAAITAHRFAGSLFFSKLSNMAAFCRYHYLELHGPKRIDGPPMRAVGGMGVIRRRCILFISSTNEFFSFWAAIFLSDHERTPGFRVGVRVDAWSALTSL